MEIWRHGHGDMDIETWTWRHGHGGMDTETWTWRHGHGDIRHNYRRQKKCRFPKKEFFFNRSIFFGMCIK
jgi:hypothetical protein